MHWLRQAQNEQCHHGKQNSRNTREADFYAAQSARSPLHGPHCARRYTVIYSREKNYFRKE